MNPQQKWLGVSVALLGAALAASLTLTPARAGAGNISPFCLVCGDRGAIDAVLNVILFLPLGAGLRMAGFRMRSVVLTCFSATLAIELLQVAVVRGRDASLGDLAWNTTGGALGAWVVDAWRGWLWPEAARAARLATVGAVFPLAFTATGGLLLQPAMPEGNWFAQWRPPDSQSGPPHGVVLDAEWNGVPLPNGPVANAGALRDRSLAAGLEIRAMLQPRAQDRWLVGVLAAADERRRSLWRVSVGSSLVRFWSRSRADEWKFRSPGFLVPVAAEGARGSIPARLTWRPGDTLVVDARRRGGRYAVRAAIGPRQVRFDYHVSPTRALLVLLPLDLAAGYPSDAITLGFLPLLFAPLGWWTGRAAGSAPELRLRVLLLAMLSVAISLVLAPLAFRLAFPPAIEWGMALGGLLVAAGAGWMTVRRARPAHPAQRPARFAR